MVNVLIRVQADRLCRAGRQALVGALEAKAPWLDDTSFTLVFDCLYYELQYQLVGSQYVIRSITHP